MTGSVEAVEVVMVPAPLLPIMTCLSDIITALGDRAKCARREVARHFSHARGRVRFGFQRVARAHIECYLWFGCCWRRRWHGMVAEAVVEVFCVSVDMV